MTRKSRLKWLDISKGIAIILMVIGHTSIPDAFSRFIFAFHMPLFFIASGWTTKWNKLDFCEFVVHRLKSIMLPFVYYSAIVLLVQIITNKLGGGILLNWFQHGWQGYALWFVPVLFLASVLGRFIHIAHNLYFRYSAMVALVLLGAYLRYINLYLPWSLSSVPYASFFVLLGTELKNFQILKTPRRILLVGGFMITLLATHFGKMDMAWNAVIPILPLIIGSVAGTMMVFSMASYIDQYTIFLSKVLTKIGKETFVVVAFSQEIIILLHDYTSLHSVFCYLILIVSLTMIVLVKNNLKK